MALLPAWVVAGPVPSDDRVTQLTPVHSIVWSDFLGVNAGFLMFKPEQVRLQMNALRQLGLQWVRVDVHWIYLEPEKDHYDIQPLDQLIDAIKDHQLKALVYLVGSARFAGDTPFWARGSDQYPPRDSQLFADRMAMLARRYPSVSAWQIWNEPNSPAFWRPFPNAHRYAELASAATTALRKVDPEKPVVLGGMAYYSDLPLASGRMFDSLAKEGTFGLHDIAAYHPYTPEPEGFDPKAQDFLANARQANQFLRQQRVPGIWATEWGWSSYAGPKEEQPIIGEQGQADYLLRRLALMSALDFDRIFLFALSDLDDRASVRDRSYGLLDLEGRPKPAYKALSNFLAVTGPRIDPGPPPAIARGVPDLYSVGWTRPDGKHLWMFWAPGGGTVRLSNPSQALLHQPLTGKVFSLHQEQGPAGSFMDVPVSGGLQILEWD